MNNDRPRVDLLVFAVWLLSAIMLCVLGLATGWLLQRLYVALWPWVSTNIDGVVVVIVAAGVGAIAVLARKGNPSW